MANQTAFPRPHAQVRRGPRVRVAQACYADTQSQRSAVPGHRLSVAGLVIEADGTETQAIAALLHDAAEDQGGELTLTEIEQKFGAGVASIVAECSDTFETPKPPARAQGAVHRPPARGIGRRGAGVPGR